MASRIAREAYEDAVHLLPTLAVYADRTLLHTDNKIDDVLLTDGGTIKVNEDKFAQLDPDTRVTAMAHELLHVAMQHVQRQTKDRDDKRWHTAADISVNGMLQDLGLTVPEGAVVDPKLCYLSVEEIYDRLPSNEDEQPQSGEGEGQGLSLGGMVGAQGEGDDDEDGEGQPQNTGSGFSKASAEAAKANAGDGEAQAEVAGKLPGKEPLAALRALQERRSKLLRKLKRTWMSGMASWMRMQIGTTIPDRRFLYQGLYLENYDEEDTIAIAVDTSGSVDDEMVTMFLSFVQGLLEDLNATAKVLMIDSKIHSVTEVQPGDPLPPVKGRGGTHFGPFHTWLEEQPQGSIQAAFYFTDGYGYYPDRPADVPMFWILWPDHQAIKDGFGESIVMDIDEEDE